MVSSDVQALCFDYFDNLHKTNSHLSEIEKGHIQNVIGIFEFLSNFHCVKTNCPYLDTVCEVWKTLLLINTDYP